MRTAGRQGRRQKNEDEDNTGGESLALPPSFIYPPSSFLPFLEAHDE